MHLLTKYIEYTYFRGFVNSLTSPFLYISDSVMLSLGVGALPRISSKQVGLVSVWEKFLLSSFSRSCLNVFAGGKKGSA